MPLVAVIDEKIRAGAPDLVLDPLLCYYMYIFNLEKKPFDDVHRVRNTIRRAIERRRLVSRNRELEDELRGRGDLPELVGSAPRMRALVRTIQSHACVPDAASSAIVDYGRARWRACALRPRRVLQLSLLHMLFASVAHVASQHHK